LRKIINITLLALLLSCKEKESDTTDVPPGLIPRDTFVKVLADFALAEAASNMNIINARVDRLDSVYAFNPLKEHKIRKTQYDSTVKFYTEHPDLYKKIYESVLADLTELQSIKNSDKTNSTVKKQISPASQN
jgi:hypothetical protein